MSNRDQAPCIFETTAAEKVPEKRKDLLGFVKVVRRCPPVQAFSACICTYPLEALESVGSRATLSEKVR